jgi:starvation-inducible DNA-binding protein
MSGIRALAHFAPGSLAAFGKLASISDAPPIVLKALEMIRILVVGHEAVARTARAIRPLVSQSGDEPTADLLTQRMAIHEQTSWMLRSLLAD